MSDDHAKLNRLRGWFLALAVLVVFAGALIPIGVTYWIQAKVDEAQFDITCTSVRANVDQLKALRSIARELGIPAPFDIPEVPPECE
jgi:hypothetical protein